MTKQNNSLKRITILAMMFLYAMISFVTNLAAPVGKIWGNYFEGDAQWLGMLGNFMNFAAYLFMGIPAGNFLAKYGYKNTVLTAIACGFVGIAIQFLSGLSDEFWIYLVGAFVGGFCVCMLNTVTNPMLNLLGGGGNKGNQLNMIGGTLNSLAGALTPMMVGAIIGTSLADKTIADINIVLYIAMAVFVVVFLIIWLIPLAEPSASGDRVVYEKSPWSFRHFVLGVIAIFFYVGVEVGIPASIIDYLVSVDLGFSVAGFVAGLYWLLMLVGRIIGSAIGGKVSAKAMICFSSTVAILLMGMAMIMRDSIMVNMISGWNLEVVSMPLSAIMLMACGLCTSVMWGSIFNLATEGLGKYTAKASGIFMMMVVGGGILPLLQSWVGGITTPLLSYIVPIMGVTYILFYALLGAKNVNTDIKID